MIWIVGRKLYVASIVLYQNAVNQRSIQTPDEDEQSKNSVKLLRIRPGFFNDPIKCELRHHKLESLSSHIYIAISYTWGNDLTLSNMTQAYNSTSKHREKDGNTTVPVTSSAFEVLQNLRSHVNAVTIWIDALCIDQNDKEDNDRQIPLMSKIYENANTTVIWLCPSPSAALAVSLVNRIFLLNRLNQIMGTKITYEVSQSAARALQEMLQRSWFERAWIVLLYLAPNFKNEKS